MHAGDSMPSEWNDAGRPRAVITNTKPQGRIGIGKLDIDGGTGRVPSRVRERLLDDAVGDELDVWVEGDGRAAKDEPRRTTGGLSCFVDQVGHLVKTRLRSAVDDLAARILTQDAEQSAHLDECVASSVADRQQPFGSGGWKSGNGQPSCFGLDGDHRDVVRDHVVQFTRDASPLPSSRVLYKGVGDVVVHRAVFSCLTPCPQGDTSDRSRGCERGQHHGECRRFRRRGFVPVTARTKNGTARPIARSCKGPLECDPRPSRYNASRTATPLGTLKRWKLASENMLAAQTRMPADAAPSSARGTVLPRASRQSASVDSPLR